MSVETQPQTVDTAKVIGRRELHYNTFDEIVNDAERLAEKGYRRLGNWSLGQICKHLAVGMQMGLDGSDIKPPWLVRFVAKNFIKKRMLTKPFSPGFRPSPKITARTESPPLPDEDGLSVLREITRRWKSEPQRHVHSFFGPLTADEWDRLSLRHAELHMSFLVPEE